MTSQPGSGEGASNSCGRDGPGGCLEAGTGITPGQQDPLWWGSCSGQILAMGAGLGPAWTRCALYRLLPASSQLRWFYCNQDLAFGRAL